MTHPSTRLPGEPVKYAAGIVAILVLCATTTWSAGGNMPFLDMTSYITQGYTIDGPFEVVSANSDSVTLMSSPEDIVVDCKQKNLLVKDQNANPISFDAMTSGKKAYVLRRGNQVVVFLVPATPVNNSNH